MPTIAELTSPKETDVYCGEKCPYCGGTEFLINDIYDSIHEDKNGNNVDCVEFECQCESDENCCKEFTIVYKKTYLKTITK